MVWAGQIIQNIRRLDISYMTALRPRLAIGQAMTDVGVLQVFSDPRRGPIFRGILYEEHRNIKSK